MIPDQPNHAIALRIFIALVFAGSTVRFLAGDAGMDSFASGAAVLTTSQPAIYAAATTDFRHMTFAAARDSTPQLLAAYFATSTNAGLYSIGPAGAPPNTTVTWTQQINGASAAISMGGFVGFHVQDVYTIWALNANSLFKLVVTNATRAVPSLLGQTWTVAAGYPITPAAPTSATFRYVTARAEGGSYSVYIVTDQDATAGEAFMLRHVASDGASAGFTIMATGGPNRWFRGVFLPPCDEAINGPCSPLTPTPFPTPSVSLTATASLSPSASISASVSTSVSASPTGTSTLSGGAIASVTNSATASPSVTPSVSPYKFSTSSIVVLRLGNGDPAPNLLAALPYFLDEYSVSGDGQATLTRTLAMPATNGNESCTGTLNGAFLEGGGSNSFDGRFIVLPCSPYSVGSLSVTGTAYPDRHVVRVNAASQLRAWVFSAANGIGNMRGAATVDGKDVYLLSGGSVRYAAAFDSATEASTADWLAYRVTPTPVDIFLSTTNGGTNLMRHVAFAADTQGTPQLMVSYSVSSTNNGIYAVGNGAPNATGTVWSRQINGNSSAVNMTSLVGFHVQAFDIVWAISSGSLNKIVAAPGTGPRPRLLGATWSTAAGYPLVPAVGAGGGLRFIVGRSEAGGVYALYVTTDVDPATGTAHLLRHVAGTNVITSVAVSGANRWFRGVYLPPCDEAINGPCSPLTPTPFPTPSVTPSVSVAPSISGSSSSTSTPVSIFPFHFYVLIKQSLLLL